MTGKKLGMEGGRFVWVMPDGSKRPFSKKDIQRAKSQLGQAHGVKQRKKNNEG